MYPPFQAIDASNFMRSATDFQRYLFNKLPLRNDRKSVLVRSGVWLLEPGTRSHVRTKGDWHIDGTSDHAHIRSDERTFILSSPCSALTEFNVNPLEIESSPSETRNELTSRIGRCPEEFGVIGRQIDPCRIYTFENHLHRAVDPKRVEFRFFLRVTEIDKPPSQTGPLKRVSLRSTEGIERPNIEYGTEKVSIYFPRQLRPTAPD